MDGELLGAFDVEVNGSLFDVEFVDGKCGKIFTRCNDPSDFTFQSFGPAADASLALLDQVFVDTGTWNFQGEDPIHGCSLPICAAITPYDLRSKKKVDGVYTENLGSRAIAVLVVKRADFAENDNIVWAVWTPVPEPSTALLVYCGLLGIAVRRRMGAEAVPQSGPECDSSKSHVPSS